MPKRIALIDGDVMCYRAFQPRWKADQNYDKDGVSRTHLDEEGNVIQKVYTAEEDALYLQQAWKSLQRHLVELKEKLFCDEVMIAVDAGSNFRKVIFPEYKMHLGRTNATYRPSEYSKFIPFIRKLWARQGEAIEAEGREADDLLRIWAEECRAVGQDFIVVSIDKDLLMIPGKHYNLNREDVTDISIEEGRRRYYTQILMGDQMDNIPGVRGMGPKKTEKHLKDCVTDNDFQEAVVSAYIDCYGDDWYNYLLINGKLIHLQTHINDVFDLLDWPVVQELRGCIKEPEVVEEEPVETGGIDCSGIVI